MAKKNFQNSNFDKGKSGKGWRIFKSLKRKNKEQKESDYWQKEYSGKSIVIKRNVNR